MNLKTIKGFPKYEVSDQGKVWRKARISSSGYHLKRKELSTYKGNNGYPMVYLHYDNGERKGFYVHRLVYETFKGEIPPKFEIDHIDGNRGNNSIENLRAVSHKTNCNNPKSIERYKSANSLDKGKFNRDKMEAARSKEHEESLKSKYIIIWLDKGSAVGVYEFMQKAHVGYPRAVRIIKEMQGKLKKMGASIN